MARRSDNPIAALNDAFRAALPYGSGGCAMLSRAVADLPPETVARIMHAVCTFTAFTVDNDPWGEHDFAAFTIDGERINFKFDYYADARCESGAEDGGASCYRVLTIMLASDY